MSGKFITIEGLEGVGKSTCIESIHAQLKTLGKKVIVTREPGGTALAERIRNAVLDPVDEDVPEVCELLLVFAARSANVTNCIRPALEAGHWVVSDRFTDATYAYQGGGRGLSREAIGTLEDLVQEGLKPDLTLLLDAPISVGRERADARNQEQPEADDRFEREDVDFYEKVRGVYLDLARAEPKRIKVIDATLSVAEVKQAIADVIRALVAEDS